jgi:hypothetical protein
MLIPILNSRELPVTALSPTENGKNRVMNPRVARCGLVCQKDPVATSCRSEWTSEGRFRVSRRGSPRGVGVVGKAEDYGTITVLQASLVLVTVIAVSTSQMAAVSSTAFFRSLVCPSQIAIHIPVLIPALGIVTIDFSLEEFSIRKEEVIFGLWCTYQVAFPRNNSADTSLAVIYDIIRIGLRHLGKPFSDWFLEGMWFCKSRYCKSKYCRLMLLRCCSRERDR